MDIVFRWPLFLLGLSCFFFCCWNRGTGADYIWAVSEKSFRYLIPPSNYNRMGKH
jgi:hypothetical protein